MKQVLISLFSGILIVTACTQEGTAIPVITIQNATSTPSLASTSTSTSVPSETPTPSITPLPTIPTFTPTFDTSSIVTVTSALKAECPKKDPSIGAKFATPNSGGSYEPYRVPEVLDYLNAGGTLDWLQNSGLEETTDLTGDGLHEVLYKEFGYSFFGCKDGHYHDLLYFVGDSGAGLADVLDLNRNGIPEIILYNIVHYGYIDISVFEWDGNKLRSLIDMGRDTSTDPAIDWVSATDYHKLIDINREGLKEIVVVYDVNQLCGGFGDFCDGTPAREQTTILGWNGQNYVVKQRNYTPAQYRFQAIQDGDTASSQREYDKALSLYQEAIITARKVTFMCQRMYVRLDKLSAISRQLSGKIRGLIADR